MLSLEPGWQAFIATTSFGAGYTTLVCVSLTMDYEVQDWYVVVTRRYRDRQLTVYASRHVTLMTIFIALLATAFNTFAARRLPMFEGMILYLHIILWFGVSITLCSLHATFVDIDSSIFRSGSLRPRYPPLKYLGNSKIGVDGRRWVQQ
jgi:hypothetical protein